MGWRGWSTGTGWDGLGWAGESGLAAVTAPAAPAPPVPTHRPSIQLPAQQTSPAQFCSLAGIICALPQLQPRRASGDSAESVAPGARPCRGDTALRGTAGTAEPPHSQPSPPRHGTRRRSPGSAKTNSSAQSSARLRSRTGMSKARWTRWQEKHIWNRSQALPGLPKLQAGQQEEREIREVGGWQRPRRIPDARGDPAALASCPQLSSNCCSMPRTSRGDLEKPWISPEL